MRVEQRRQIEPVGLDDPALPVASAIAFAVRAVFHRHQAELDQVPVDRLDLGRRKAKGVALQRGRRPDDRAAALAPVLRLGEGEQPVNGVHDSWRNAEPWRRRLQGSQ